MICVSKKSKIKTKMVQEQWLQLKMTFLFFYWVELTFGGEGRKIWWEGGGMSKFLAGGGTPPIPPVGKTRCYIYIYMYIYIYTYIYIYIIHIYIIHIHIEKNFANRFVYTMKKLRVHHIHHMPKWPSYFCKIGALCVSQIYMVYIFTCLLSVHV